MDITCGSCVHYKGAKIKCGQGVTGGLAPLSPEDSCAGRFFEAKPKGLCKEIILNEVTYLCTLTEGIDVETAGLGIKNLYYASPSKLKNLNLPPISTPKLKPEYIMSNAIIRLADSQLAKQIEDFGGLQLDIREALEEMQKEEQKTAALQAAKEVMAVLKAANDNIEQQVLAIRNARKSEQRAKERIEAFNKAKAYGKATNNFVPLSILLGLVSEYSVENKELLKIDESKLPEGWDKKGE